MYIFLLGIVPEVKIAGEPDQAWESLLSLLRFFRRRNLYTALYHWIKSFFNESTNISLLLMGCKNHNSLLGIVFPLLKTLSKMNIYTWVYWIWTYLTFIQTWIEISCIPRNLIIVIFYYQISLKPLKTLSLSQVSFPLLFPLYYIVPPVFTNSDKGKHKGKKIL